MHRRIARRGFAGSLGAAALARPVRTAAADAYTLRLTLPNPAESVQALAGLHFASAVKRRSSGQLSVEVYPNGQLAKEQESIDGLSSGVIDFAIITSSVLVPVAPKFQAFNVPFLFKDAAAAARVTDGAIGGELFASLEPRGILGLGWGVGGFRQYETTSKAVSVPDDLKGLRMRILSGAIYVATTQALGAIPVVIDFSEAFTALSQHTIDGMDIVLDGFASGKYYAVVKHVAMTNHILSLLPLLASKRKVEALPAPLQTIVRQEAKNTIPFWRESIVRQTNAAVDLLKKNGVAFTEVQHAAFRKAVDPVYALVQQTLGGDLLERIGRVTG